MQRITSSEYFGCSFVTDSSPHLSYAQRFGGETVRHEDILLGPEFAELPFWSEWIQDEFNAGPIDTPSAESCLDFIRAAIKLAGRIRRCSRHFPSSLRRRLMEAAILYQCWQRQKAIVEKARHRHIQSCCIPHFEATDFVRRVGRGEYLMTISGESQYEVKFPEQHSKCALATEVIGTELARAMGIPTTPLALINVCRRLATRAGFAVDRHVSRANPTFDRELHCLGLRCVESQADQNARPERFIHPRTAHVEIGVTVFNVLTLNTVQQREVFRPVEGRYEPVFKDFNHSLNDADWASFLRAGIREPIPCPPLSFKIKSYEQLEPWIRRAEQVNLDQICETAVKLPCEWYDNKPAIVAAVIEKLHERVTRLRAILLHAIRSNYFENMRSCRATKHKVPRGWQQ